jgi:hypothetical protein
MHDTQVGAPDRFARIVIAGAFFGKYPKARLKVFDDRSDAVSLIRKPTGKHAGRQPPLHGDFVSIEFRRRRSRGREGILHTMRERFFAGPPRRDPRRYTLERCKRDPGRDAFARQQFDTAPFPGVVTLQIHENAGTKQRRPCVARIESVQWSYVHERRRCVNDGSGWSGIEKQSCRRRAEV